MNFASVWHQSRIFFTIVQSDLDIGEGKLTGMKPILKVFSRYKSQRFFLNSFFRKTVFIFRNNFNLKISVALNFILLEKVKQPD